MTTFYSISCSCLRGLFWAFYRHKVFLPDAGQFPQGVIIAANHASFLDPPLIASSFPTPVYFLARKTLFDLPVLSPLIKSLNALPLASGSELTALKQACKLLGEGKNMLIFPEGTRSLDGTLAPFKTGVSLLSQKAKAPIIPTYIHGSFEAWPRHKQFPSPFGHTTSCVFGSPIYPQDFTEGKEGQQAIAHALEDEVRRLQTWYESEKR
jgi:1-acyl-sn-glycerol-3-phosphate acyltransferase